MRRSDDDIDDAARDDDDLLHRLPGKEPDHILIRQRQLFNLGRGHVLRHADFRPPLAVDLDRQGDGVVDQQRRVGLGPGRLRAQALRRPASPRSPRRDAASSATSACASVRIASFIAAVEALAFARVLVKS